MRTLASRTVRPNHSTRWPNRYVFAAVAGTYSQTLHGGEESFRFGVIRHETRQSAEHPFTHRETAELDSAGELWKHVDAWHRTKARTVLVAHNVSRFLQITDAFRQLTEAGWTFENGMIDDGRAWCTWTKERATLVVTDLTSWSSLSIRRLAAELGHSQGPLEVEHPNSDELAGALRAEVLVIADAWHRLRSWCEENDAGMWRPTGAGQSWAHYRHRFLHKGIVHHGDEELYVRERTAVWSGRAEAWRHGVQPFEQVHEWDMNLAYARIGAECNLPTRVLGTASSMPTSTVIARSRQFCILADCLITTQVPCVPCEQDGRIVWPVGTFRTTLWSPEITLAARNGAEVECTNVVLYRPAPILKAWGEWIVAELDGDERNRDPIVHSMLKQWARTVVGRFGLRYASWEAIGELDPPAFGGWPLYEFGGSTRSRLMALGRTMFQEGELEESPDSAPAVMGFVMAECRVRLWRAMQRAGLEHVLYVDTDGMLVDPEGSRRMARARGELWRLKHSYNRVEIIGPRQLIVGREVKAAGVPFRARTTDGRQWEGETASSPFGALRAGDPGALVIRSLRGRISAQDRRRRQIRDGSTRPISVAL